MLTFTHLTHNIFEHSLDVGLRKSFGNIKCICNLGNLELLNPLTYVHVAKSLSEVNLTKKRTRYYSKFPKLGSGRLIEEADLGVGIWINPNFM